MTDTEKRRCSARVHHYGLLCPCQHFAVIERDGKWYCKTHDPQYIRAKREKQQEKLLKAQEARRKGYERDLALSDATMGLSTEELKAVTPALIRAAIPMRDACQLVVDNETKADSLRNSGMVDDVDLKVLRANAKVCRLALSLSKEGEKVEL